VSKSLYRLSKHKCDENLRKWKHGYHATVRLLEYKSSILPYVLSGIIQTNDRVLQLMAFDPKIPKIATFIRYRRPKSNMLR
jgi:hypothetical protein